MIEGVSRGPELPSRPTPGPSPSFDCLPCWTWEHSKSEGSRITPASSGQMSPLGPSCPLRPLSTPLFLIFGLLEGAIVPPYTNLI